MGGDDVVDDADQGVGAVGINVTQTAVAAFFQIQKVMLEVTPHGGHVKELPQAHVERKKRHNAKRKARRADQAVEGIKARDGNFHGTSQGK